MPDDRPFPIIMFQLIIQIDINAKCDKKIESVYQMGYKMIMVHFCSLSLSADLSEFDTIKAMHLHVFNIFSVVFVWKNCCRHFANNSMMLKLIFQNDKKKREKEWNVRSAIFQCWELQASKIN